MEEKNTTSLSITEFDESPTTTPLEPAEFQDVDRRNIDVKKLVSLLRNKFDRGTYELHMVHDVFSVRAPRRDFLISSFLLILFYSIFPFFGACLIASILGGIGRH
ncbi:hypothetical protein CEP53_004788 [Fusarium sp. AF-6]|nr:hypothetical protein CEP53_004788 [Fusarium sp. AF-6]